MSRLPVTDRSCERSQTFNSPDFYMEWNAHNSVHLNAKTQKQYNKPKICKQSCTKMMQVPPMPSPLISYTIFQILLSWIAVGLTARLSTWIPRLPPNVTDRSGEHSQTFNSTDFDGMESFNSPDLNGMKYTQKWCKFLRCHLSWFPIRSSRSCCHE